jgi:hypothetical protein
MWSVLRKIRPTKVVIAFDNDTSGNKAAQKLAPRLAREGANVHRLKVPQGKDINEYVCLLVGKDKNAVAGILQGLCVDAPLICRADPGAVDIAEPASITADTNTRISSLAANEKSRCETDPDNLSSSMPEKQASKEKIDLSVVKTGNDIEMTMGDRVYRVRGLSKNQTFEVMRVNVRVMNPSGYHIDTLDLYNARHRTAYINAAADELRLTADVIKKDLGRVLLKLEALQDEQIDKALEPQKKEPEMTAKEREEAVTLLKSPDLLDKILQGFDTYGLVGERTNKLTGYLAAVSRKLDKPLAVVIQSSSASGKSTMMEAILDMMPEQDRIQYSAMTGQSLFYFGDKDLKHKILAIVEEEGVRQASYALKLLQSEGRLTIASTGKDNASGQMVTKEYHVEGPVMIFTTTTAIDMDEELLNRCIILTIDESREQTKAIHQAQRRAETLDGLVKKLEKKDVLKVMRNAQRLLSPFEVINPYADDLTFLDDNTRTRRDHKKYLTLIRANAYLHQYQRPVKVLVHGGEPVKYIEATLEDIEIANQLACEVLGRSLDELPPQSRRFLDLLTQMVQTACKKQGVERCDFRFTQRDVRQNTGWSDFQVKSHLRKLVSLEYVLVHHGGRGQRFVYELLYNGEGRDGGKFLMCLSDVNELKKKCGYDQNREHENPKRGVSGSIQGAPGEPSGSTSKNDPLSSESNVLNTDAIKISESTNLGAIKNMPQSYNHPVPMAAKEN